MPRLQVGDDRVDGGTELGLARRILLATALRDVAKDQHRAADIRAIGNRRRAVLDRQRPA